MGNLGGCRKSLLPPLMLFRKQNDALPTVEWFRAFLNHYSPTTDPHFQIHSLSHPAVRYFWRLSHPLPCQVGLLNCNALLVVSLGYLPPTGPEEMKKVHVFDLEWNGAKWHFTMNFSHVHKNHRGFCPCLKSLLKGLRQLHRLDPVSLWGIGFLWEASKRPTGGSSAPKLADSFWKQHRCPGWQGSSLPLTSDPVHPGLNQNEDDLWVVPKTVSRREKMGQWRADALSTSTVFC